MDQKIDDVTARVDNMIEHDISSVSDSVESLSNRVRNVQFALFDKANTCMTSLDEFQLL